MGLLAKQIKELKEGIEGLDRESLKILHEVKNIARHLRDNRLNVIQGPGDSRQLRLNRDQVLQEAINAAGECYIHCKTFKLKYKKMMKQFEQDEQRIEKELIEGIRRALE